MHKNIPLKTSIDVAHIRKSCRIIENCLRHLQQFIAPGLKTQDLNEFADEFIRLRGAIPSLKGYNGFPGSICTSVNNVAAHGIPSDYILQQGDVLSVDITVSVDGWYGDAAWSYIVGEGDADRKRLLRASWKSTLAGIDAIISGFPANLCFGDVGHVIQTTASDYGCTILEDYVGHGIGESMHEEPMVPHFGKPGTGQRIIPGMVFTIEPIVTLGDKQGHLIDDGWTLVTTDNSLTAQFEHTLAVFKDRVEILTFSLEDMTTYLDFPPFF